MCIHMMYVGMYTWMQGLWSPEEGISSLRNGIMSDSEPPEVGSGT